MMAQKPHEPSKPVSDREEVEELLVAGLRSGEPKTLSDGDWEALRRRALDGTELRKSS